MCTICGTTLQLSNSPQAERERVFINELIAAGQDEGRDQGGARRRVRTRGAGGAERRGLRPRRRLDPSRRRRPRRRRRSSASRPGAGAATSAATRTPTPRRPARPRTPRTSAAAEGPRPLRGLRPAHRRGTHDQRRAPSSSAGVRYGPAALARDLEPEPVPGRLARRSGRSGTASASRRASRSGTPGRRSGNRRTPPPLTCSSTSLPFGIAAP